MKVCKTCNVEKSKDSFYLHNRACKACCTLKAYEWRSKNPEAVKKTRRKAKLKKYYGISLDEYDKMLANQNGVCAVCSKEHTRRPLNVDHCHSTGKIRGLLCDKCNMALGLLEDSKEIIQNLERYLNAYSTA